MVKNFIHITLTSFLFVCVFPLFLAFASQPAYAAVTEKDFQVILRTLGFVKNGQTASRDFAIIYDPSQKDSVDEASQLETMIRSHKNAAVVLSPRLVPVSDLEKLRGSEIVFLTTNTRSYYNKVAKIAQDNGMLSFSLDRTCVEQGSCIVYINTQNRVEILVNQQGAQKSNIQFKPVFLMMVTIL